MAYRFGVLIVFLLCSGCHYESVFSSNPKDSLSFVISAIIAGLFAYVYTKWWEWREK